MKIESTMNLDHLADLMYLTGSKPVDAEVVAMRDLLLQGQESHKWQTTSDVEDAEWFAMLDEAVSSAAKEIRDDAALVAAAPDLLAALLEVVAEWDARHADEDHRSGYTLDTGGIAQARAAIARATGRQF